MPIETTCRQCKTVFTISPSAVNESGNFCNRRCYAEFQKSLTGEKANQWKGGKRVSLTCAECNVVFEIKPGLVYNRTTGVYRRFCSKDCWHKARARGWENPNWKGGRSITDRGYVMVWAPHHPKAIHNRVPEHRLVMEQNVGRILSADEVVHHIDGNRSNNAIENLQILSPSEHSRLHREQEKIARASAKVQAPPSSEHKPRS